jgi:hypothetical protein
MAHKFKIGETVGFTPPRGSKRTEPGTFTIVAFLPAVRGKSTYRIRHTDSGAEHDVRESELYRV